MSFQQTLNEIAKFHFILDEGRKGIHLLFSPERIRSAMARSPADLEKILQEKLGEINEALNQTFTLESFEDKRAYLETLAPDLRDALVFGYFQLLEGSGESEKILH